MHDIKRTIPAGKSIPIDGISGDFIYCKHASGAVRVIVQGQPTEMIKGDWRKEPKPFDLIEIDNQNDTDVSVILTIGRGEFDRKIVTGEITVTPGVTREDGSFVTDRRYWRELFVNWADTTVNSYEAGDTISTVAHSAASSKRGGWIRDGVLYLVDYQSDVYMFDAVSGDSLGSSTMAAVLGITIPWATSGAGVGQVSYDSINDRLLVCAYSGSGGTNGYKAWQVTFKGVVSELAAVGSSPNKGSNTVRSLARDPVTGGYIGWYYNGGGELIVYDDTASVIEIIQEGDIPSLSGSGPKLGFYTSPVSEGLDWALLSQGSSGSAVFLDRADLMNTGTITDETAGAAADVNPDVGFYGVSEPARRVFHADNGTSQYKKIAMEDFTEAGKVYVQAGRARILRESGLLLYGDYSFTTGTDGRKTASGALIKAALTALYGEPPPDDYLDHVFYVEFSPGEGSELTTIRSGGTASFAAEAIADNFTVKLPFKIKLFTDL